MTFSFSVYYICYYIIILHMPSNNSSLHVFCFLILFIYVGMCVWMLTHLP